MSMSLSFTATHPCPSHATARAESHAVMEWTSGGCFSSLREGSGQPKWSHSLHTAVSLHSTMLLELSSEFIKLYRISTATDVSSVTGVNVSV